MSNWKTVGGGPYPNNIPPESVYVGSSTIEAEIMLEEPEQILKAVACGLSLPSATVAAAVGQQLEDAAEYCSFGVRPETWREVWRDFAAVPVDVVLRAQMSVDGEGQVGWPETIFVDVHDRETFGQPNRNSLPCYPHGYTQASLSSPKAWPILADWLSDKAQERIDRDL